MKFRPGPSLGAGPPEHERRLRPERQCKVHTAGPAVSRSSHPRPLDTNWRAIATEGPAGDRALRSGQGLSSADVQVERKMPGASVEPGLQAEAVAAELPGRAAAPGVDHLPSRVEDLEPGRGLRQRCDRNHTSATGARRPNLTAMIRWQGCWVQTTHPNPKPACTARCTSQLHRPRRARQK